MLFVRSYYVTQLLWCIIKAIGIYGDVVTMLMLNINVTSISSIH
jgi:hypothetical protein